jgi:hypothetical protein
MQNYFEKIMIKIAIQNRFFSNLVGEEGPRIQGVKDSSV